MCCARSLLDPLFGLERVPLNRGLPSGRFFLLMLRALRACSTSERGFCGACLCPDLTFRSVSGRGVLLAKTEPHHSSRNIKRRIKERPWPVARCSWMRDHSMAHMGSEDRPG